MKGGTGTGRSPRHRVQATHLPAEFILNNRFLFHLIFFKSNIYMT